MQAEGPKLTDAQTFPLEVLVVDDDPTTRDVVSKAVRRLGHACRDAEDGFSALQMITERHADVVISDWTMPGMSGAELCRRTRELAEETPYTYFILLTAYADREHLLGGMAAGADDYQTKPVDLDELEARLMSASRVVALHRKLALRNADLRRDSQRFYLASRTDALTGIGNRLALDEELATARDRATRYGHRFCLAMGDVDRFKDYNDRYGHLAGDDLLRRIATTIKGHIRASDRVFRYGGEEFVVVLPQQPLAEACSAIDRVRHAIENLAAPGTQGFATMSFGLAELHDQKVDSWLALADAALYSAKRAGRNRVVAS
jgi:diguanylate cyclase (GGDEF)-like protein